MRNKRGTDHTWHLIRYKGDLCIYAKCSCGYRYGCSKTPKKLAEEFPFKQVPTIFYPFCPSCGARKNKHSTEIEKSEIESWFAPYSGGLIYDMSGDFM